MDLDPFCPIGITAATIRFLDIFLMHCLLSDGPADTPAEIAVLARNELLVARQGRDPQVLLTRGKHSLSPAEWGGELLREYEPIADTLDAAHRGGAYRDALAAATSALVASSTTPSARVLQEMAQYYASSFPRFALARSLQYKKELLDLPLPADALTRFESIAAESLQEQRRIEAADTMPFEVYRQRYLSPDRLRAKCMDETTRRACI